MNVERVALPNVRTGDLTQSDQPKSPTHSTQLSARRATVSNREAEEESNDSAVSFVTWCSGSISHLSAAQKGSVEPKVCEEGSSDLNVSTAQPIGSQLVVISFSKRATRCFTYPPKKPQVIPIFTKDSHGHIALKALLISTH